MWRIVYKACQRYGAIQENPANLRVNGHPAGISRKFEIDQIIRAGCGWERVMVLRTMIHCSPLYVRESGT
jgi:hypothetical protein